MNNFTFIMNEMSRENIAHSTPTLSNYISVFILIGFWIVIFCGIFILIKKFLNKSKYNYQKIIQSKDEELKLLRQQNEYLKQIANNKGE